jgi:hypothetical protein
MHFIIGLILVCIAWRFLSVFRVIVVAAVKLTGRSAGTGRVAKTALKPPFSGRSRRVDGRDIFYRAKAIDFAAAAHRRGLHTRRLERQLSFDANVDGLGYGLQPRRNSKHSAKENRAYQDDGGQRLARFPP